MTVASTASGLLAMLQEQQPQLKKYALHNLNSLADSFWHEISASISTIESFYEDEYFEQRELAALVASKVFYYLGEHNDSLTYALGANSLFDVLEDSDYVRTLVAKCLDQYIALRKTREGEGATAIDPRLVAIVERMLDKCMQDRKYQQAIGMALDSQRLDKLQEAIRKSENVPGMLAYCFRLARTHVDKREFRQEVLRLIVNQHQGLHSPDYLTVCQCLMFLNDPQTVANILDKLIKGDKIEALLAYQIAFDLFENENQLFLLNVRDRLPEARAGSSSGGGENTETTEQNGMMDVSTSAEAATNVEDSQDNIYVDRMGKLKGILSGETPINLTLQFLYSRNKSDLLILKTIKHSVETRNSVCHSATIYSNALMHAGTTVDTFLRDNLDWLSRATNWAKFSATAGLGVIHRGHLQQGRSLMAPYLPQDGGTGGGSPYSEGGALYALGLIHANHGEGIKSFLLESLRKTNNEVIQHGACLGLGLAALGTADDEIYEDIKHVLYTDSAIAGEAAGIAMGLLMVGSASDKAGEMLTYAHDTQHEKIIRGLALGIALVVYGREEEADTLIEQMTRDQDPILRYGGMYALALAYRGTSNNSAIRRLLHFAVSDVSDDVRRAAVLALGFVLCSDPTQTPKIVSLLSESYNAHVRYGAAMAVGISCAGTASSEAISLLEPLTSDAVDFVRQGALMAMAMVLMQATEAREPHVSVFRRQLDKIVSDKHEDTMSKMGAILAYGILDAGGRNVTISLQSRTGHDRVMAVVGMAVFTQFWYWYPLTYFVSLSFAPTAFIGLNHELRMPKFDIISDAKPALFAYPAPTAPPSVNVNIKLPTAVLSTSGRSKSKAKKDTDAKTKAEKQPDTSSQMDVGSSTGATAATSEAASTAEPPEESSSGKEAAKDGSEAMEVDSAVEKKAVNPEATSEVLSNPARVIPLQEKYVRFPEGCRYAPVKRTPAGFVMLRDLEPSEPVELVSTDSPASPAPAGGANGAPAAAPIPMGGVDLEPAPPEPFVYVP
ncbi:26S proteasome non-ATPase regulatory subunit 1 homolog B [Selaginella moellendorffii]|uniref:26S proteasome non-ATPase regulatory subunit 1 homolog B n=1 Tax=Selaginella moellendorffii TaxID=88036 RepID=UPI000D1C35FA|nr:26S proteasome non-ATPase regulatory subunit 1 homolog B [Selaginella moellendorffii]|eukprot:XP_024526054.1 26S proteasome non-ATPase regulatory subunit 1 homolog B [Selaginella moellendorffii]